MQEYLSYKFQDSEEFINTYDELPLWSAPFGILLLRHLELKQYTAVVDIGSGTGFPLLEFAERIGRSCQFYGIDPSINANRRARQKIKNYGLANVEIIDGYAEQIPLPDRSTDLVISNLGVNNFKDPSLAFAECNRILRSNGKIALTTNLNGHWKEFYAIFRDTLLQLDKDNKADELVLEEEHRGSVASITKLLTDNGFRISSIVEESFQMKFLDGTAFLNHHFIKLGWLSGWMKLFEKEELADVFSLLEQNLNSYAARNKGLVLTVPMAFIEGEKI